MKIILALLIAFFAGSIPTAFIMGRLKGIDIRKHGSGNVGATNAFRILGKGWGIACLVFDMLKGLLPVVALAGLGAGWTHPELWKWILGLTAIAGHMFSPFLNFKGGKGVATSLGVVLAISPVPMLIVFVLGLALIFTTGYVSVASITGASLLPLLILAYGALRPPVPWISFAITLLLGVMIVWKHRSNIERLRNGTEKRILGKAKS